jgi:hypothetical protein
MLEVFNSLKQWFSNLRTGQSENFIQSRFSCVRFSEATSTLLSDAALCFPLQLRANLISEVSEMKREKQTLVERIIKALECVQGSDSVEFVQVSGSRLPCFDSQFQTNFSSPMLSAICITQISSVDQIRPNPWSKHNVIRLRGYMSERIKFWIWCNLGCSCSRENRALQINARNSAFEGSVRDNQITVFCVFTR